MSSSAHLSFFLPIHIIFKSLLTLISLSLYSLLLTIIQCHSCKYSFHIDQSQFSNHESFIESLLADIWPVFLSSRPPQVFLFLPPLFPPPSPSPSVPLPHLYLCSLFVFKTGLLCVSLGILELALYTRLALTSEICLPLPHKDWD